MEKIYMSPVIEITELRKNDAILDSGFKEYDNTDGGKDILIRDKW